ncbi:MAG: hypothetical protein AAF635_16380, partial [Cyanobacteria bacterium P01_C01_bin.69]
MARVINAIFTASLGEKWRNQDLLPHYEKAIEALPLPAEKQEQLADATKYFLMGQRERNGVPNWLELSSFDERAAAFETLAEKILNNIAEQVHASIDQQRKDVVFDAIITTTSTGNLMPGLSYRLATKLGHRVNSNTAFWDLGNVGCTGSLKALNLANSLDSSFSNILVAAVEAPTTLINLKAETVDIWQGNCTFGDGAAALWLSFQPNEAGPSLRLDKIVYQQYAQAGLDLIHWKYSDYYTFALADEKTFNQEVQSHVSQALSNTQADWQDSNYWASHPAGITLLLRLSRKLGISRRALKPSAKHF